MEFLIYHLAVFSDILELEVLHLVALQTFGWDKILFSHLTSQWIPVIESARHLLCRAPLWT